MLDQPGPSDLDRVLSEAPQHEADRLREVWALAGSEAPADFPDPAAIERVWQSLDTFAEAHDGRPRRPREARAGSSRLRRVWRRPWMAVAATLLIGGAVGLLALGLRPVVQTAAPGRHLTVTLPDGSQVVLNSGTSLRYARRFGRERAVYLEGEAFFDVVKEGRPFVVHTFNARVTVPGTRFNVRAWSRSMDPATTATLASGRIALAPAGRPDRAVTLEPGQTHRIAQDTREPGPPDSVAVMWATAWRNGDLVFKDQWLGVILEDVERRFDVEVTLAPRTLREERLTLASRNPVEAQAVIRDVCVALGLNYREISGGYEIYAPAPR